MNDNDNQNEVNHVDEEQLGKKQNITLDINDLKFPHTDTPSNTKKGQNSPKYGSQKNNIASIASLRQFTSPLLEELEAQRGMFENINSINVGGTLSSMTEQYDKQRKNLERLGGNIISSTLQSLTERFDEQSKTLERLGGNNIGSTLQSLTERLDEQRKALERFGGNNIGSTLQSLTERLDEQRKALERLGGNNIGSTLQSLSKHFDDQRKALERLGGNNIGSTLQSLTERLDEQRKALERLGGNNIGSTLQSLSKHFDDQRNNLERLGGIGIGNSLILTGIGGNFSHTLTTAILSINTLVFAARKEGKSEYIPANTFDIEAIETLAAAENISQIHESGDSVNSLSKHLEYLIAIFSKYIEKAKSRAEAIGIYNSLMFIISSLSLFFTIYSSNSNDIINLTSEVRKIQDAANKISDTEKLRAQIELQRLEIERRRLTIEEKNSATIDILNTTLGNAYSLMIDRICVLPSVSLYQVKRTVPLKMDMKMKSETLAHLSPGDVVGIMEKEKKWVKVEYYDPILGGTREGWVVKKYLCRMN